MQHNPPGNRTEPDATYALFVHLSQLSSWVIGPFAIIVTLVLWLARKDDSPFLDDHGREAMNFTITMLIYSIIVGVLFFVGIGICLLPVLLVFEIVAVIIAATRAANGQFYRYPMTIRFIS